MGTSRIEQLIEDIYEFVENCRMQPLSTTKVIVPKDELYDLLDELKLRTPDEIKRYQKIIANRDAIIADAEEKAAAILAEADEKAHSLINDNEIMQQAYYQANEVTEKAVAQAESIIASANFDAHQIRSGALAYTEELLSDVEQVLTQSIDNTKSKYESYVQSLQNSLNIVKSNKQELTENQYDAVETEASAVKDTYPDEEYNFDEDTFLQDIE